MALVALVAACNMDALAPDAPLGCGGYVACVGGCGPRRAAPAWSACEHACNLRLSSAGRALLDAANTCYTAACHTAGLCTSDGKDPVGTTFRTCFDCRETAAAQLYGSCDAPGDPACDRPACAVASSACAQQQ